MQRITILGATGSIGVSHARRGRASSRPLPGLRADRAQPRSTSWPRSAALPPGARRGRHADAAARLARAAAQRPARPRSTYGEAGAVRGRLAAPTCDTVMAAIVGAAGLAPTLAAARAGKKILLANKEALVMSGQLFMDAVREHTARCCCRSTASTTRSSSACRASYARAPAGGRRGEDPADRVGRPVPARAPSRRSKTSRRTKPASTRTGSMGRKISVDSATMMNKGLEVIEAHWLFGAAGRADRGA